MKRFTSDSVEERVADVFSLPNKLRLGMLQLYMCSNQDLLIENYKGILVCRNDCIKLSFQGDHRESEKQNYKRKNNELTIIGNNLKIAYFTEQNMKIVGCIQSITFD